MLRTIVRTGLVATAAAAGVVAVVDADAREAVSSAVQSKGGAASGLVRFGRTCGNAAVTAADYKLSLWNQDKEADAEAYKEALSRVNLRAARRLYSVCHKNGGLYTKFGQGVANLNHALPAEFTDVLAPLQDQARAMPREMALEALRSELGGRDPSEVFDHFDPEPLAAASLAQVHRAELKGTGEAVAVKIQYPYLQAQTNGDLATLRMLTDFVGLLFPDFSYSWLTPEFENNMELELDFVQEGRNGERMARMFANHADVYVPTVHWQHTTKRLLIMEFIDGIKITNVDGICDKGINPLEVAATVSAVFGDMIHVHGFAHCDPHPGNLLVRASPPPSVLDSVAATLSLLCYAAVPVVVALGAAPVAAGAIAFTGGLASLVSTTGSKKKKQTINGGASQGSPYQVVILDHGMYRRLEPEFRTDYCMLWKALLRRDVALGRRAALRLGVSADSFDTLSLLFTFRSSSSGQKTGQRMSKEERSKVRERYKDVSAGDVNQFLQRLPRDLLFVMRCTNIVRSINLALGGSSRLRFNVTGESAVRGLLVENPPAEAFQNAQAANAELPYHGAYSINLPVASELVDADTVTYRQALEMWRLRTYLSLIDSAWAFLTYAL